MIAGALSGVRPELGHPVRQPDAPSSNLAESGRRIAASILLCIARMHLQHPQRRLVVECCFQTLPVREHARLRSDQARTCGAPSASHDPRLAFDRGEV
jgi:hypothetical protein